MSTLVQYIILRGDLRWDAGAMAAQAAHASVAAIHVFRTHPDTECYLGDLEGMRKIVLSATEQQLSSLRERLCELQIDHYAWIENPETILTAIALRPYPREQVKQHLKHLCLAKTL